jgi:N-acyl-D-amino-acid deacylase
MREIAITGGLVADGTGACRRPADILIRDGRIAAVEPPGLEGGGGERRCLDATGRIVCPGFIDLHSHGDLIFAMEEGPERRELLRGRIAQGITTEMVGNCGLGPAPVREPHEEALRGVLAWMTPAETAWRWGDLGGYLDHLEAVGVPVNVAALQAHGSLRIAAAGLQRELSYSGSARGMEQMLEKALDQGAFGMSLGLIYPPGSFTPQPEIRPLARVLGRRGGLLTAHVRGSSETLLDAVAEILSFGIGTGARVHHSHSEAVGPSHWSKIPSVLEMEERARAEGVHVTFDMFPYTAAATSMAAIYPPWSLEGGLEALVARLEGSSTRDRMRGEIRSSVPTWPPWVEGGWAHNLVRAVGWERITVGAVGSEASRWAEGLDLAALGERTGQDPFDAISDLMVVEGGRISQIIHGISGDDEDDSGLVTLMTDPHGAFCTDANDVGRGLPHPAAYGAFPSILGRFVRERHVLDLDEAIRKMTSYPAFILGLRDRGVIRRGAAADIVIFDPARIGSRATYADPRRLADGIDHVLVNGEILYEEGRILHGTPGEIIRSRQIPDRS